MQKCLFPNHTQNNLKSIFAFEGFNSDKPIRFVHRNLFKVELLSHGKTPALGKASELSKLGRWRSSIS